MRAAGPSCPSCALGSPDWICSSCRADARDEVAPLATELRGLAAAKLHADAAREILQRQAEALGICETEIDRLAQAPVEHSARSQLLLQVAASLVATGTEGWLVCHQLAAINHERCRPPLPETEVLAIIDGLSAAELEFEVAQ